MNEVSHYIVAKGDNWYKIANKIAPKASPVQRAEIASSVATANGLTLGAPLYAGRILCYDPTIIPPEKKS